MKPCEEKAKFFDKHAGEWERNGFSPEQAQKVEQLLNRLGIKPGMTILEPGCGSGRLTRILSERVGPNGKIIAIDISPKMIEACRRTAKNANVRVIVGEIESLGIEERSVDMVLCFAAFPHFSGKRRALTVFKKCLKPEGTLAIAHLMGSAKINALHRKAGPAVRMDVIPSAQEMEVMFQEAGLRIDELADDESGYFLLASHSAPQADRTG